MIIGDESQIMQIKNKLYDQGFILIDSRTGEPLANIHYKVFMDNSMIAEGKTDSSGRTTIVASDLPKSIRLEIETT